ncbi:MAG: flagellar M-ring protein FliF C-terminal domain-containing protein [Planctomycetota bacterium]|jgi:flagellar biosynthesis/type III secretory pathway M-ring protein FliF/YscJ
MNESILKLFEQIREASLATKVTFASLLLGAVAVAGGALLWSNRPHYVTLHQGLTDTQFAAVGSSLAEAGIAFKHSAPPGPITVYVDESRLPAAQAAMFLSNALTTSDGGILTDNSVFKSAGEREQAKRKREWQEMEQMLTTLDFVRGASVKTFHEEVRAFGSESEITGSVSLTLVPGHNLTQDKARTVAKMVRFGLGVSEEKLIVTQQDGSAAYDGEDLLAGEGGDWNEQVDREDRRLEDKANELLAAVLGPGRARVSVRKQRAAVYEESNTQKTPQFAPAPVGGYAGSSGNLIDPAVQESTGGGAIDARTGLPQPTQEPQVASITDTRTEYEPSKTVTQTVRRTPRLERMSVSMFLDTSLAEQEQALVRAVKATVGFVETRDSFESALHRSRRTRARRERPADRGAGRGSDGDHAEPDDRAVPHPWGGDRLGTRLRDSALRLAPQLEAQRPRRGRRSGWHERREGPERQGRCGRRRGDRSRAPRDPSSGAAARVRSRARGSDPLLLGP